MQEGETGHKFKLRLSVEVSLQEMDHTSSISSGCVTVPLLIHLLYTLKGKDSESKHPGLIKRRNAITSGRKK